MNQLNTREVAQAINARNARVVRRAEAIANILVALAIAALGVWALLAYFTPCDAGNLCMAVIFVPTRVGLLTRLRLKFRSWLLRWRLADVHANVLRVEDDLRDLPYLLEQLKRRRSELNASLAKCELGTHSS
jgi:hypothetical protein